MKIQKKYFLIYFALFSILSLAMSLTTYFLLNKILLNKYEQLGKENLNYLKKMTERETEQLSKPYIFISNNTLILERLTNNYDVLGQTKKMRDDMNVSSVLNAMSTFDVFEAINFIYIYSENGEEYVYGADKDMLDIDDIKQQVQKVNMDSKKLYYLGFGKSYYRVTRNNNTIKFSKKFYDNYNNDIGVVFFELSLTYFQKLYNYEDTLNYTKFFLVDDNNKIIYHPDKRFVGTQYNDNEHLGLKLETNIKTFNWKIISESSSKFLFEDSFLVIKVTLLMAFLSITIAFMMLGIITGKIVNPIKKLSTAMAKVQDGDLTAKVVYLRDDEIGELANNFNIMTSKLKLYLDNEIYHAKKLNDAEYKALQAQINPHFMYNSLNSVKWLANIQKADNISKTIDSLWLLLKMTSSLKGQFIPLSSEIEIIEAYCRIQQLRYKGKFTVKYYINDEHSKITLPKYILQPFVENSIFHGIEPKKGTGKITVKSEIDLNDLIIYIIDDGIGFDQSSLVKILNDESIQKHNEGLNNIGIKNVNERLILLYGASYGINICSQINKGTTIKIRIPINV